MRIEIRADGAHISGYVNVTGKRSRPVITPRGKVIEEIEPRAFEAAIGRSGNITVTVDHDNSHVYASTDDGTLKLFEDDIGLHADVLVTDDALIELAKRGKVKGWSFGMYNVQDEVESRADELPLRRVKSLDLDHLTLVVHKTPELARRYEGYDKGETPDEERLRATIMPYDVITMRQSVLEALMRGYKRDVSEEETDLGLAELQKKRTAKRSKQTTSVLEP